MPRHTAYRPPKIPEMTIRRLSVYPRCLLQLEEDGVKTVSSQELAERFNLNSAQVRKDLAYFGEFGVRGIGYYVSGLNARPRRRFDARILEPRHRARDQGAGNPDRHRRRPARGGAGGDRSARRGRDPGGPPLRRGAGPGAAG